MEIIVSNNLKIINKKFVLCGPHNEKHIRTLWYSADNNRRKTGRQTRNTKTNMGRWSKRLVRKDKTKLREQLKGENYMGHLQPIAVDATLNDEYMLQIRLGGYRDASAEEHKINKDNIPKRHVLEHRDWHKCQKDLRRETKKNIVNSAGGRFSRRKKKITMDWSEDKMEG